MAYGCLSTEQRKAVREVIQGRVVTDLGAGNLSLSAELLQLGATQVIAVDKERAQSANPQIQVIQSYFKTFLNPIDVAFVSWPSNWETPGLIEALARSTIAIYLGKNSDGACCGTPKLFDSLHRREVLAHVPERKNTLIIYGSHQVQRPALGEECAAMNLDTLYSFDDLVYIDRSRAVSRAPRNRTSSRTP